MSSSKITSSSTAEYFSKNLQQVGFSSGTKAVLTTLKESVDNSLDACEDSEILPEIDVLVERVGAGAHKNMEQIRVVVVDNGPGIATEDLAKVYGEYLASSKFGRGRCSRGQQGIGISAATTWAQMTTAHGVKVITKTPRMPQALSALVEVDIKKNQGIIKNKKNISWDRPHGTSVEFLFDGRLQLQGEGGLLTYLRGTSLVNPHLTLKYKINDEEQVLERVSKEAIDIPEAVAPHPHTMKFGEFLSHMSIFGKVTLHNFFEKGFSRISDQVIGEMVKHGFKKPWLKRSLTDFKKEEQQTIYQALQQSELMAPSTRSVLRVGEEALSKSVDRLGEVDFFSVVSRKPRICDAKPVVVEVAIARLKNSRSEEEEEQAQVLRFANRVPLQFDKSGCAIVKAIESVNWRAYGLVQPKNSIPLGPYVIAVSVVSPFIKFKNASKETIDTSDELLEELRLAIMQAGQKLSRYIKKEMRAADYEQKIQHIEQFGPILIEGLARITNANEAQKKRAREGLMKILGRDSDVALEDLKKAEELHSKMTKKDPNMSEEEAAALAAEVATKEGEDKKAAAADAAGEDVEAKPAKKEKAPAKKSKSKAKKKSDDKQTSLELETEA